MKRLILQYFCVLSFLVGESTAPGITNLLSRVFSFEREPTDTSWQCGAALVHDPSYHMSTDTEPIIYWLNVNPNLTKRRFTGEVKIKILARRNTKKIELNAEKLHIKNVNVSTVDASPGKPLASSFNVNSKHHSLIITMTKELLQNNYYEVLVTFNGYLYRNNPFGFAIYSSQTNDKSVLPDAYMAETLFDPYFAQKAFPCYDNPEYKTPFTVTLNIGSNEQALSNYSTSMTVDKEKQTVTFTFGVAIPINALYYAILSSAYRQKNRREKYFVWATEKYIDKISYALEDLENASETMQSLLDQKLRDSERVNLVIPIRDDEELPLLYFVKKNFLCDTRFCTEKYQQEVTRNIIHKVSEKWFGSYLSISSFQYLWMRDGIAMYYGYKISDMIKSNWRMSDFHGSIVMQSVLLDDEVYLFPYQLTRDDDMTKKDIFEKIYSTEIFSFYNEKAALILRMLEHIVGENTFNSAMKWFLYHGHDPVGVLTQENLWQAFERQMEIDEIDLKIPDLRTLSDVMNRFTSRVNYPFLQVEEPEDGVRKIIIKQEDPKSQNNEWIVPITVATATNPDFENTKPVAWSTLRRKVILETVIEPTEWYILNVKNTVYCRVNYPSINWLLLCSQLITEPQKIGALNRAQLIADAHELASVGRLSVGIAILTTSYLHKEQDPIVWMVALNQFKRLYASFDVDTRPIYQKYFVECVKPEYKRIGFNVNPDDSHPTKMWKNELTNFLCWIGDEDCVEDAFNTFNENNGDLAKINPELLQAVTCTVLRAPNNIQYRRALNKLIASNDDSCLKNLKEIASICENFESTSNSTRDRIYTFVELLKKTVNGEPVDTIVANILSSYWDTHYAFMKVVAAQLVIFKAELTLNLTYLAEINGLAKFIRNIKGQRLGIAELELFLASYVAAKQLLLRSSKYKPIEKAFVEVSNDIKLDAVGEFSGESMQEMLSTISCHENHSLEPDEVSSPSYAESPLKWQLEELRSRNSSSEDEEAFGDGEFCRENNDSSEIRDS